MGVGKDEGVAALGGGDALASPSSVSCCYRGVAVADPAAALAAAAGVDLDLQEDKKVVVVDLNGELTLVAVVGVALVY